jgi:hypothetical protein
MAMVCSHIDPENQKQALDSSSTVTGIFIPISWVSVIGADVYILLFLILRIWLYHISMVLDNSVLLLQCSWAFIQKPHRHLQAVESTWKASLF